MSGKKKCFIDCDQPKTPTNIGVGRFRILGGGGGVTSHQRHFDVVCIGGGGGGKV